jgi:hypothetical protein
MKMNKSQKKKIFMNLSMTSDDMTMFNQSALEKIEKNEDNIFKSTNIIGDVDPKTINNLEFLLRNNTYEEPEIIKEQDEEYNY